MAQISASYHVAMARALPGQVSDTSAYNIDGACVLEDGEILVGVAVQVKEVDALGHKVMKPMAGGGTPYGVAIRSHFQTTSKDGRMIYEVGSGINVMSAGRVWMVSEDTQAQTFGTPVKLTVDGKVKSDGAVVTGWTYTGEFTTFQDLKLSEVQLHQI
ncbi:hypothetical protein ELISACORREA_1 [Citrobacter phage vB_CfrD_ElisaCorrea]|jgi:hypothetical protein|uniref:Uncharacterized protein n=1 Tax=Citrobacter phage vB_CfrD_ElisaCorrea TaxID=2894791 RepID=A0AAE9CC97_9CAUD|nr:hypothetical protein ELISACORREA_1 [Citrobacter phage vB_CfrD_ElisaCorrea]